MPELQAVIEFPLDDRAFAIRQFIRRVAEIMVAEEGASWCIDLRECRYVGPDGAALVLATFLEGKRRKQRPRILLPSRPPQLEAFCEFSGLNHWIAGSPEPNVNHAENETVPLRVLHRANFKDPDPIIELVRRHIGISSDSEEYLRLCVNEVTQNVEDHSDSAIGGVYCARYLDGKQQVRVAIVDRGVGIATTLRRRYPDTTSASVALQRVVQGEYSSKSRVTNAGLGISFLWNAVSGLGGSIFVISEDGIAQGSAEGYSIEQLEPPFPGTGVFFTIPVVGDRREED